IEHRSGAKGFVARPGATSVRMCAGIFSGLTISPATVVPAGYSWPGGPSVATLKVVTPNGTRPPACVKPSISAVALVGSFGKKNGGPVDAHSSCASLQLTAANSEIPTAEAVAGRIAASKRPQKNN